MKGFFMLNFVKHYYEVTEENHDILCQMIKAEDIRYYSGTKVNVDDFVRIGRVLGNNQNDNPKQCGYWTSKSNMYNHELKKLTTEVCKQLFIIE